MATCYILGERIVQLRSALGWSQVDVAARLNVAKQTVSNWEHGAVLPSIGMLVQLADLFHVSVDYMLGRETAAVINVEGLPEEAVAHLSLLVDDCRQARA